MDTINIKGIDKYTINANAVDPSNQLKISSLLQFFKESATNHATQFGLGLDQLHEQNIFWALIRITLEIEELPTLENEITIVTWSKMGDNAYAYRDFLLYNSIDLSKPLVKATSSWSLLNTETRRPQKVDLPSIPFQNAEPAIENLPPKVDALPCAWNHSSGVVNDSDIYTDGHFNNARYLDWICNVYSKEHYEEMRIGKIDINFIEEAALGDSYKVNMASKGSGVYLNNVVRNPDQKELVRTRIQWLKR